MRDSRAIRGITRVGKSGLAGLVVLGGTSLLGLAPAGAQGETATLTVTKTVVGPVPADAQFTIHVHCVQDDSEEVVPIAAVDVPAATVVVEDEDLVFGPEGGSHDYFFDDVTVCTVTETDDGGAASSSGGGEVFITSPTQFDSEIVNTFVATATTQAATTTTAAAMAVAQPRFTG